MNLSFRLNVNWLPGYPEGIRENLRPDGCRDNSRPGSGRDLATCSVARFCNRFNNWEKFTNNHPDLFFLR